MKISKLTDEIIKEFCGIDGECNLLDVYKSAAQSFIKSETGLNDGEIDEHEDLSIVYLMLINDMSLNRDYVVIKETVNPTVSRILGFYSGRNLIG